MKGSLYKIESIDAYKASDGAIYEREDDCHKHEVKIAFEIRFSAQPLYSKSDGRVECDDMRNWLYANGNMVIDYLESRGFKR